jgi:hypothetical protein
LSNILSFANDISTKDKSLEEEKNNVAGDVPPIILINSGPLI